MSTIQDLNTARTISYNDEGSYAIVFGANAGNVTANVDAYASANITQRTTLTSITSPVRDLLLDVQFSNVGNVSMAYVGTYSNIGLLQVAPAAWRVNGIRSVAQYTEAFANVKFTDLSGGFATNPDYSYVTTVNDQSGNTRAWTTTLNVIATPTLSVTGNVIYNEDTLTNVTVANVLVDAGSVVTFRLFANTIPTYGAMSNGVVTGNSIFIDGNAASLNSQITAGGLKFLPATDFVSNVGNAINFSLGNISNVFSTANANIQIGTTHDEYSFPNGTYTEDTRLAFGNTITDLDTHALSFTIGIQQTAGNAGVFYRSNVAEAGNANTRLNITNNKASINNTVEWMPPIDYTGNVSFTYNQIKTLATGNVTQASNVVATFTAVTNPEISNMGNRTYTTNTVTQLFSTSTPVLDDGPNYGQSYTITLNSPVGKFGNSDAYFNSNTYANIANTYTFTGNTTSVNANFANIRFAPANASTGNSTFTYTQSRDGTSQVNVTPTLTANVQPFSSVTYTYTGDTVFTPSFSERTYAQANILVVGGGGGGVGGGFSQGGGGGGGGGIAYSTAITLVNNPYTVTIGQGGIGKSFPGGNTTVQGGHGTDTSITSDYNDFAVNFGLGGNFSRQGGSVVNRAGGAGGTGAGAGGDGSLTIGSNGGSGVTNVLTGTAVLSGGGGGGGPTNGAPGGNSYGLGGQGVVNGSGGSGSPGVAIIKFY